MIGPARSCPYVGLVPYSEEDWEYFFGRETEIELVIANLAASRLTLLFGASGVGKSSVLRAGVMHRLTEQAKHNASRSGAPELAAAVFSTWRDEPIAGLMRAVREAVGRAMGGDPGPPRPGDQLADTFAGWAQLVGGEIVVVLDQFEEYFLYHGSDEAEGSFAAEFSRLVNDQGLRMSFLVAIREDAVARLDRFKGRIPNLFDNYLRLRHLGLEAAEDAIRKPLEAFNRSNSGAPVGIEDALVREVLRQTRTERLRTDRGAAPGVQAQEPTGEIETPYLQMVITRLWEEEAKSETGLRTLRLSTFVEEPPRGLGGADRIVRTHLDAEMAALGPTERDVAAEAFRYLVTRTGTKIALAVEDLSGYTSLPAETLAPVLEKLAAGGRRILRPVPVPDRPGIIRYEIFHDVLGPAITDWGRRHSAVKEQEEIRREEEARRTEELRAAEAKREQERSRFRKIGIRLLSAGVVVLLGLSAFAWQQRREARMEAERARLSEAKVVEEGKQTRLALEQAQRAIRETESATLAAIQARSVQASRVEPDRAKEGKRLREAFLGDDTTTAADTARRLGLLNETVRFRAERVSQNYEIKQGQVSEYRMRPAPESIPGGLSSLAAVTFKMNHPTFRNRVIVGDPKQGFRGTYVGWGCLMMVPVLLEYENPRRPPEVALFEMCSNLETASR